MFGIRHAWSLTLNAVSVASLLVLVALIMVGPSNAQQLATVPSDPPIFSALDDQDLATAKAIIEADPKAVNARNHNGLSPLNLIAFLKKTKVSASVGYGLQGSFKEEEDKSEYSKVPLVAELLIAKGADVNAADDSGVPPLASPCNHR